MDSLPLLVVYHYKLAHAVPLRGDASYSEIAATSGLKEDLCRRFIRCAAGSNFFEEDPVSQRVRHTAPSRVLVTNKHLYDAVGFQLEDVAPSATKIPAMWNKFGQDVWETNKCAFSYENNTDLALYDFYKTAPERGRRFGSAMQFYTTNENFDLRHMFGAYDWTDPGFDQPGAQLIDVGGGHGQVSYFVASKTKNIRFQIRDLAEVVERGKKEVPEDLKGRVDFLPHSFLKPQPVSQNAGPVHIMLRYILHNWSDKYCVQILQNLRPLLKTGSRILIGEFVLPDHPVKDLSDRFGFQMDMIMATLYNAEERRAADFQKLFRAADSRFEYKGIHLLPGTTAGGIVEFVWKE
jgi:ubiquinone/menaquinone biosynthesis C-methylase UbiE